MGHSHTHSYEAFIYVWPPLKSWMKAFNLRPPELLKIVCLISKIGVFILLILMGFKPVRRTFKHSKGASRQIG